MRAGKFLGVFVLFVVAWALLAGEGIVPSLGPIGHGGNQLFGFFTW